MVRIREHYGKDGKSWMPSVAMQTRFGPLVCLVTLLALIFIPLLHHWHLCGLEKGHAFHAAGIKHEVGLHLSEPGPDKPQHSHHDGAICPICHAASRCRCFSAPTLSLSPIFALQVQWFCQSSITSPVASPFILTSGSRAPPNPFSHQVVNYPEAPEQPDL
jgi:hypothetical protein